MFATQETNCLGDKCEVVSLLSYYTIAIECDYVMRVFIYACIEIIITIHRGITHPKPRQSEVD